MRNIYSALFVDFDNIYISLKDTLGKDVAGSFATNPTDWLNWVKNGMSTLHFGDESVSRHILIRKCYLNPATFGEYRPYFTRAGFEIVDCPKLTERGKTSTDIHMVMDIMDALQHPSKFDEFILFSADADFTPVLLRIRQHKRLSVIVAAGYASPAYLAACDHLPSLEEFITQALGKDNAEEEASFTPALRPTPALKKLADLVSHRLTTDPEIGAHELPALFRQVAEFRDSTTWLEYRSLTALTKAIVSNLPNAVIYDDKRDGSWSIQRMAAETSPLPAQIIPTEPVKKATQQPAISTIPVDQKRAALLKKISVQLITTVRQSPRPVSMATLAAQVKETFGAEMQAYSGWFGQPQFKTLIQELDLDGLKVDHTGPTYIFDPSIHAMGATSAQPGEEQKSAVDKQKLTITEQFKQDYPELEPLAAKIHQLTDTPYLLPEHYAMILTQIARAVNENGFHLTQVSRLVRDRCVERGAPVSRFHVNFIIFGIGYAGHSLGGPGIAEEPNLLAGFLLKNTRNLCTVAQMSLTEEDERLLRQWLVEKLATGEPISS